MGSCCNRTMLGGGISGFHEAWSLISQNLPPKLKDSLTTHWHHAEAVTSSTRSQIDELLAAQEPIKVVIITVFAVLLLQQVLHLLGAAATAIQDHGLVGSLVKLVFRLLKSLPVIGTFIQKEKDKVVSKITEGFQHSSIDGIRALPQAGKSQEEVLQLLHEIKGKDKEWQGRCSGTVYMGGADYDSYSSVLTAAYGLFAHTNPLHPDVFPSGQRFEKEVVAMGASLFGGDDKVCGNVTTGGTESILMAVKTARDYARAVKGITQPELVMAESAHPAYDKACHYFGIKLRRARVGKDFRADVHSIRRLVNRNTVMIVASAPGYPHGTIDPIEEMGRLALRNGVCLHVDCCLGGFVLPFARKLGYPIPPFHFSVPGVTSISADVHKYGLAPKGNSLVLYKNRELRRHQFLAVTDWTGGLYVSPTATGSRAGGLQAAAWAALLLNGEDGYLQVTKRIMEAAKAIQKGIATIEGLFVLGEPAMTVVAFGSHELDVYKVNDVMSAKGWSLNALQRPPSVHICVTLQHVDVVDAFLTNLAEAVDIVRSSPDKFDKGMAPIYGAAGKMPDRGTVGDLLVAYMDAAC